MSEDHTPPDAGAAPETPAAAPHDGTSSSDDRTMAMLAHLLGIFTWFIGALVIWMMKRETSPFVDDQGKEALNFQITIGILYVALALVTCVTFGIGSLLYPVAGVVNIVFCIIAAISSQKGDLYRYPVNWRVIK